MSCRERPPLWLLHVMFVPSHSPFGGSGESATIQLFDVNLDCSMAKLCWLSTDLLQPVQVLLSSHSCHCGCLVAMQNPASVIVHCEIPMSDWCIVILLPSIDGESSSSGSLFFALQRATPRFVWVSISLTPNFGPFPHVRLSQRR